MGKLNEIYINGVAEMAAPVIFKMKGFLVKGMLGGILIFIVLWQWNMKSHHLKTRKRLCQVMCLE